MSIPLLLCTFTCLAVVCAARVQVARVQRDDSFIGWNGETFNSATTFSTDQVWVETLGWQPRAFLYHNFLTPDECDHLIHLAKPHMEKSKVVDNKSGQSKASEVRTSSGHFLRREQDEVVARIERRIAEFTKLPMENGESLHILNYKASEKYDPHYDYFHDQVNTQNGGQRMATMLMYLSDVEEGGETVFPHSKEPNKDSSMSTCAKQGLAVKATRGSALLFYSLKPDQTLDDSSLHAGCPVIRGDKWSATKWIRQRTYHT